MDAINEHHDVLDVPEVRGDIEFVSEDELVIINGERDAMLVLRPKSMLPADDPATNQSEFILSYIL